MCLLLLLLHINRWLEEQYETVQGQSVNGNMIYFVYVFLFFTITNKKNGLSIGFFFVYKKKLPNLE